ncbi:30S ribosomal protein S15 [Striga asiatica]|uniref:30S ribosomal protein S15 n=1 Tax=Striga asiatica TaxID=4170 RepID=A0A5A7R714_STRAF|nr:30S ribosomal protein S15 [Striga asiatica]
MRYSDNQILIIRRKGEKRPARALPVPTSTPRKTEPPEESESLKTALEARFGAIADQSHAPKAVGPAMCPITCINYFHSPTAAAATAAAPVTMAVATATSCRPKICFRPHRHRASETCPLAFLDIGFRCVFVAVTNFNNKN